MGDSGVSVLIPVHGDAEFLEAAINSVLIQEGISFEILIILDRVTLIGSGKLDQYKGNPLLRFFVSNKPGISNALNLGIKNARFNFIARLDSDDFMAPNRLISQYLRIINSPEIMVVGSAIQIINVKGDSIKIKRFPLKSQQIVNLLQFRNCIAHPAVMVRKSVFTDLGMYRSEAEPAEDYDLWLRISRDHKSAFYNLSEPLTFYRVHDRQLSFIKRDRQLVVSRTLASKFRNASKSEPLHGYSEDLPLTKKIKLDIRLIQCLENTNKRYWKRILSLIVFCALNPVETFYFARGKL